MVSKSVCNGASTIFTITSASATSTATFVAGLPNYTITPAFDATSGLRYQWQVDGVKLTETAPYSGVTTSILNVTELDIKVYRSQYTPRFF